jgi:hypothetical protein
MEKHITFKKECIGYIEDDIKEGIFIGKCCHYKNDGKCSFFKDYLQNPVICDDVVSEDK